MPYGVSAPNLARQTAIQVDKISKGAKPAKLPTEQSPKFELVITLDAAKELTIAREFLFLADDVIE
jgi:putative ABC transport system substrate-binding protein